MDTSIQAQPIGVAHRRGRRIDNANIFIPDRIAATCVRKTPLAKDMRKVGIMINARWLQQSTVLSQAS